MAKPDHLIPAQFSWNYFRFSEPWGLAAPPGECQWEPMPVPWPLWEGVEGKVATSHCWALLQLSSEEESSLHYLLEHSLGRNDLPVHAPHTPHCTSSWSPGVTNIEQIQRSIFWWQVFILYKKCGYYPHLWSPLSPNKHNRKIKYIC